MNKTVPPCCRLQILRHRSLASIKPHSIWPSFPDGCPPVHNKTRHFQPPLKLFPLHTTSTFIIVQTMNQNQTPFLVFDILSVMPAQPDIAGILAKPNEES